MKKILFVCYGGGHGKMCLPVAKSLEAMGFKTHTLALTTSWDLFKNSGLECSRMSDYLSSEDSLALEWGGKLASKEHNSASGIAYHESVAYLGLNFKELILNHGLENAQAMYAEKGRHSFSPNSVLKEVIQRVKADLVVATNSPRAEKAAIEEAKKMGIPTVSLVDLFGRYHFHVIEADHIVVISEETKANLLNEGVKPSVQFHILGNPAFDDIYDYRKTSKSDSLQILNLDPATKYTLFIDMPAYWNIDSGILEPRKSSEILEDLRSCVESLGSNSKMIVRHHPSQKPDLYIDWINSNNLIGRVILDKGFELRSLLNAVDVVVGYTSTVLLEAVLMGTDVVQIHPFLGRSELPLYELGLASRVTNRYELKEVINRVLSSQSTKVINLAKADRIFPAQKATFAISKLISEII